MGLEIFSFFFKKKNPFYSAAVYCSYQYSVPVISYSTCRYSMIDFLSDNRGSDASHHLRLA